ncbi:DNA cytosine methyltransferase [Treponema sp. R6D11]
MTLGSLFDGIAGFPLAAAVNGITPLWASEIEAAPISISKRHFPEMKHLGDIKKINGAEIDPVDLITFGSPCQDLSVAGKRAGLEGKRSGLFLEAMRIIKEMRGKTNGKYPSRIIWENVDGAFSSNGGEDFRIVIEEIANIAGGGGQFQFLDLRQKTETLFGNLQEPLWETVGRWLGENWTLNTGECPNVVKESSLSQILEKNVPEKYYLSPKACRGILRRAERRGKELPEALKAALEQQALMGGEA